MQLLLYCIAKESIGNYKYIGQSKRLAYSACCTHLVPCVTGGAHSHLPNNNHTVQYCPYKVLKSCPSSSSSSSCCCCSFSSSICESSTHFYLNSFITRVPIVIHPSHAIQYDLHVCGSNFNPTNHGQTQLFKNFNITVHIAIVL